MKKLMVILLLMSHLVYADGDAVYLPKGQPAGFSGYLITPDKAERIRQMDIDLNSQKKINVLLTQENQIMQQRVDNANNEVNNLSEQLVKTRDNSFLTKAGFFVLGAVITGAVSYGLVRTIK